MRKINGMEYYIGTKAEREEEIPGLLPGHEFFETDTNKWFFYTGTEWVEKTPTSLEGRGLAENRPELNNVPLGFVYWSVDTGDIEVNNGTNWDKLGEV